jgi:hypothetical protein
MSSSWWKCPVCREDYSTDTQGDHAPITGVCGHTICRQCIATVHKKALEGRSRVHHLECPECLDTTFDAQNVSPNILICQILAERHAQEEAADNVPVGGPVKEENDGTHTVKEENDGTVKEENDNEPTRKSKRSICTGNQEAVTTVTPNRPVSATRDPSPTTAEAVLIGSVTPNRKRQKSSVQVTPELRNRSSESVAITRIKTELEDTDDSSTDQPSEPLWYESIQTSRPRRVFRVRQCKKDAETTTDKYGQKPSKWAVQEGYILSSARAIPLHIKTSEAAKEFLQDTAQVVAFCQNRETFPVLGQVLRYVNGYKTFCEMQKGDIVVLLGPDRPGQGRAYFGVVESDEITIWSHAKLLAEGFPSPIMFERNRAWEDKRVMLRRIKWRREGLVRDLPDQSTGRSNKNHVPWLLESVPFWMANVTEKGALDRVSTPEFMDCTDVTQPELIEL